MARKTDTFDYRKKAEELDRVVAGLQEPDIQIDEATALHAKGLRLISELEDYLDGAEVAVRKHLVDNA